VNRKIRKGSNVYNSQRLPYLRFGHRSIRFREQAVEEFLRQREKAVTYAEVNQ
jgi:hypothetical protein